MKVPGKYSEKAITQENYSEMILKYPSTRTELAELYGVSRKTFYNWLKTNNIELSKGYLCPKDVDKIFEIFGKPDGFNAGIKK